MLLMEFYVLVLMTWGVLSSGCPQSVFCIHFFLMGKISGLFLQPSKCVVNPSVPTDGVYYPCYSVLLRIFFPAWANFKICSHAEYLRFEVGPEAGQAQWGKVFTSVEAQASNLASCAPPPSPRELSC